VVTGFSARIDIDFRYVALLVFGCLSTAGVGLCGVVTLTAQTPTYFTGDGVFLFVASYLFMASSILLNSVHRPLLRAHGILLIIRLREI
jgi:hypothetical protein